MEIPTSIEGEIMNKLIFNYLPYNNQNQNELYFKMNKIINAPGIFNLKRIFFSLSLFVFSTVSSPSTFNLAFLP